MKVEDIVKIIEALGKTHLTEFHLEEKDFSLKMGKGTVYITPVETQPRVAEGVREPVVEKIELPLPTPAPAPTPTETPQQQVGKDEPKHDNLVKVVSPMVGTFYQSPSPDSPSFVKLGDIVSQGDTLCIIEAMKLMNEIESTENGKIVKILVENGELVEYGQTLFLIEPA